MWTAGAAPKLTGLYLGRNAIGDAGGHALATALAAAACAPKLKQLHLFGNQLTREGKQALEAAAAARQALTLDLE